MALIKLNNNSISAVTALPAGVGGKVLQVATDYDTTQISLNTTSWIATNLSIDFTPASASSIIIITGTVNIYSDGAPSYHGETRYRVRKDNTSTIGETYSHYTGYGGTEANFNGMLGFMYSENSGSTTQRNYKVEVQNPDTNSSAGYNIYSGYSALQIWEVSS